MSVYPIILNSTNLISDQFNNKYRYVFPNGNNYFNKAKVAVGNINIYYSWFNITAAENNNVFEFVWYGTLTVNHQVTIQDGFYDIAALNSYLQNYCITNGLYLIDPNGNFVFYLEFIENPVYYSIQFNSYPIPTALPAGWTSPSNWQGFPVTTSTPQLIVLNNNFQNYIGFNQGTYPNPTQTTIYSKISDFTPQVSNVQSIIVSCNLLNNKFSIPNTILFTFSPDVSFGSLIMVNPSEHEYINIQDGLYNDFQIEFLDQNFNPITINDSNLVIQVLIKIDHLEY